MPTDSRWGIRRDGTPKRDRPPHANEMARQIAEQMLEQRLAQLRHAGLYQPPSDDALTDARPGSRARPQTMVGPAFPARVIALAVVLLAGTLAIAAALELRAALVLPFAVILPSASVMFGLLMAHNGDRRRQAGETAARLERELCAFRGKPDPFPRDAALALRRAENLVMQADIESRLLTQRLLRNVALFCVLAIPAVAIASFQVFDDSRVQVVAIAAIFEALMAVMLGTSRHRVRTLESDLREGDYERGLLTDNDTSEARAEKLFLKHQFELKRYYDETLRQSAMLSYLGVMCMAGGFVVIGVAFYLIAREDQPDAQQIMIATLAAAGGVLANFVAVLYLAMHARTVRALTGFHQRLVGTHHVHFGNLLASRVDADASSEVLARMAVALASERADQDFRLLANGDDPTGNGWRRARDRAAELVGAR